MKVRRIDFSADEWLAGTLELKPFDRGVYVTICALIYSHGERIDVETLRRHLAIHGNSLNAALARLAAAGKIQRFSGHKIGQKRCENELEFAQKRLRNWIENLARRKKRKDLAEPNGQPVAARARVNHQPSGKEETSPYGKVSSLPARAASPPLPSRGDGDAALRARPAEAETDAPTVFDDPTLKADAIAALDRCLDAIRGKLHYTEAAE